jgi:hypothetical protein
MVLRITVLPEQWAIVSEIERESFKTFLRGIIACHISKVEDIERTQITLPNTTTKIQRYNIHRLTSTGLNSESYDNTEGERIMRISLEKNYVEGLFHGYPFSSQLTNQALPIPKTDKQKLFEAMLGFINENLQNEFDAYMNSF